VKKKCRLQHSIFIIALFGFITTACGNADRFESLILSGQMSELTDDGSFFPSGTLNGILTSPVGGEGTITNGQMNFTIGIPDTSLLQSVNEFFHAIFDPEGYNYTNITFSVPEAKVISFSELNGETENGDAFIVQRVGSNYNDGLLETVSYVFADRDLTITAQGRSGEEDHIIAFSDIELQLQQGWNVLYHKVNFFEFPFLITIEVINRDGFPYNELIWTNSAGTVMR